MVWIPGGTFHMGSDAPDARPDEGPVHTVTISGYWLDQTEVTNRQFREFVEATGYLTTAEKVPEAAAIAAQLPPDAPPVNPADLVAGSIVFHKTDKPVSTDDPSQWWAWVPGASWRHPEGPSSSIDDRLDHPVVQVSWDDALAYCQWVGKRLPTEAEWEFAARGGMDRKRFVWGDEPVSDERPQANIWQGTFPFENTQQDGFELTAPVKSFSANGYGLYDMAGNVWEWCADWYRPDTYAREGSNAINPTGPEKSFYPPNPYEPRRVQRGGSFLCHRDYCSSYRPSARMSCTPDTGLSHLGFRAALSADAAKGSQAVGDRQPDPKHN
jgi:formylglycine-generating enzyme required for sulfatase activity